MEVLSKACVWPYSREKLQAPGDCPCCTRSTFWARLLPAECGLSSLWIIHVSSIFWRGVKLPFWHVCSFWGMCSHLIITRWWTPERGCNCLPPRTLVSVAMHHFKTTGLPWWPQICRTPEERREGISFPSNFERSFTFLQHLLQLEFTDCSSQFFFFFKIKLLEKKARTENLMMCSKVLFCFVKSNTFHYHSYETAMRVFHCFQKFPHVYIMAVTL